MAVSIVPATLPTLVLPGAGAQHHVTTYGLFNQMLHFGDLWVPSDIFCSLVSYLLGCYSSLSFSQVERCFPNSQIGL